MSSEFELQNFADWMHQPQQDGAFAAYLAESLAATCARADTTIDAMLDALDREAHVDFMLMHLDNLACRWAGDGRTYADVFLKKRGWKESVLTRAYLEALPAAPLRLYRVLQVEGEQVRMIDALAPGEMLETSASSDFDFVPGDLVATRVLTVRGKTRMASGILFFEGDQLDDILGYLAAYRADLAEDAGEPEPPLAMADTLATFLADMPHALVNYWLEDWLDLDPPTEEKLQDLLQQEFWRVSYTLGEGVDAEALALRLGAMPELVGVSPGRWRLADEDVPTGEGEMSGSIQHAIVLLDGALRCYAASGGTRDRIRDLLATHLASVFAGSAEIEEVTGAEMMRDLMARKKANEDISG